jgi:hypothetical protein
VTTSALGRGVLCALAISGTSALASPVSADMQPIVWFASGTTSGAGVPLSDAALPASRIARLKVAWNLTWNEVATLLGVSRRSVHAWVAGTPIRQRNLERLAVIERKLGAADDSPAINRLRLFAGTPTSPSIYASLIADTSTRPTSRAADLMRGTVDAPIVRGRALTGDEWQLPGE